MDQDLVLRDVSITIQTVPVCSDVIIYVSGGGLDPVCDWCT
jgi:hypothetical protein